MSDNFQNVADLKDPNDKEGRTYREINNAKTHEIPMGSKVRTHDGMVLFVTEHTRDCDGTPLYSLGLPHGKTFTRGYDFSDIILLDLPDSKALYEMAQEQPPVFELQWEEVTIEERRLIAEGSIMYGLFVDDCFICDTNSKPEIAGQALDRDLFEDGFDDVNEFFLQKHLKKGAVLLYKHKSDMYYIGRERKGRTDADT